MHRIFNNFSAKIQISQKCEAVEQHQHCCLRATEMASVIPQQAIMQQPLDDRHSHTPSGSDNLNFTEAGVQRLYMARLSQLSKRYMSDAEHLKEVSSKDVKYRHQTPDLAGSRKGAVSLESSPDVDASKMMLSSRQRQLRHLSPDELFVAIGVEIDAEDHIKMKVRDELRSQKKKNRKQKSSKKKPNKSLSSKDSLKRNSRDNKSNRKYGINARKEEIGNLESTSEISPDAGIEVLWTRKKEHSFSDSTPENKSETASSNSTNSNSEKKDPPPKKFFPSRFMPKSKPLSSSAVLPKKKLSDAPPEKVSPTVEKSSTSKSRTQEKSSQKEKETKQAELFSSPAKQRGTLSTPNKNFLDQRSGKEVSTSDGTNFNFKNFAKEVEDINSRMCHSSTDFPDGDDLNSRVLETSMESSHDLGLNTLSTSISSHDILADLAQTSNSRLCRTVTDESQVNAESQNTSMLETSMESQDSHDDWASSDECMSETSMEPHNALDDLNESRISMSSQDNFHIFKCFTSVDDSYDYPMPNEASTYEHSMESQDDFQIFNTRMCHSAVDSSHGGPDSYSGKQTYQTSEKPRAKSEVSDTPATMDSIANDHEIDEETIFDFFVFPEGMDEQYLQSNARHRVKDLVLIARAADASFFVTADQKTAAYAALVQYWKGKMALNPELHSIEGMKMFSCDPDLLDEQYNVVMEKLDPQIRPWYRACS